MSDQIRVDYDQLADTATRFAKHGELHHEVLNRLRQRLETLAATWSGQGAAAFFGSMEGEVLPALQRLIAALQAAHETTLKISQTMRAAEEEAASLFRVTPQTLPFRNNSAANTPPLGPTGPDSSGSFTLGEPVRPNITHDGGFTEFCAANASHADCSPNATLNDYTTRAKYEALLRGAKALGHLDDGTEAYERYLYGGGKDWRYDYGEFAIEDQNGSVAFNNIMSEAQRHAEIIGQGRTNFSLTSGAFPIGSGDPRFPYPSTENWQKAIGAHHVWVSSYVVVSYDLLGRRIYTMELTYHAEDRYNFNPGAADIASGNLDRDNGRFEVLGWAHPYMSYGQTTRTVTWVEGDIDSTAVGVSVPRRSDQRIEIPDR